MLRKILRHTRTGRRTKCRQTWPSLNQHMIHMTTILQYMLPVHYALDLINAEPHPGNLKAAGPNHMSKVHKPALCFILVLKAHLYEKPKSTFHQHWAYPVHRKVTRTTSDNIKYILQFFHQVLNEILELIFNLKIHFLFGKVVECSHGITHIVPRDDSHPIMHPLRSFPLEDFILLPSKCDLIIWRVEPMGCCERSLPHLPNLHLSKYSLLFYALLWVYSIWNIAGLTFFDSELMKI